MGPKKGDSVRFFDILEVGILKVDIVILHHSPGAKHGLALLSRPNFVRFVWKKSTHSFALTITSIRLGLLDLSLIGMSVLKSAFGQTVVGQKTKTPFICLKTSRI
jgi:hypothetical protein